MIKSKDAFLKAASIKTSTVKVGDDEMQVTELDAQGRTIVLDLLNNIIELQKKGEAKSHHYASLNISIVAYGLRNEDGSYMFKLSEKEDCDALRNLSDKVLTALHREICLLSGLESFFGEKK